LPRDSLAPDAGTGLAQAAGIDAGTALRLFAAYANGSPPKRKTNGSEILCVLLGIKRAEKDSGQA
jgi:hypothetical protein